MTEFLIAARATHFAATVLATGLVFFRLLIAEPAMRGRSAALIDALQIGWTRTLWTALVVSVLSGVAWLVILTADIYGQTITDVVRQGEIFAVAVDTRFGHISCARLVLAVAIGALMPRPSVSLISWKIVLLVCAASLLASLAWVGHAGAAPGVNGDIHLISDVLHLLAAGAWVGGLLPLAILLALARGEEQAWQTVMPRVVGRFSVLGIVSVGALLATGIINALYLVGSFRNLFGTDYGRLVLVKIVLFVVMVGIASVNKLHLTPRLAKAGAAPALRRNSLIELAIGALILLAVAALGTMPPAAHNHAHAHAEYGPVATGAAFVHIHSENGMADVTLAPGQVGTARATIRLWHEDLTELPAKAVTLILKAPAPGSNPLTRKARQNADGSWEVEGIPLGVSGNWTVNIEALLSPSGRLDLDGPIVIEP